MKLFAMYHQLLQSKPLLTKSITGGFICSSGDFIVQFMELNNNQHSSYNWKRYFIAWAMGTFVMAPFFHFNFHFILPKLIPKLPFDTSLPWKRALGGMLIDQTIVAFYLTCHYLMFINLFETGSLQKGIEAIHNKFQTIIINNWKFWPIAQMINFLFIPKLYQVLWVNFLGLFWNVFLSYTQHH